VPKNIIQIWTFMTMTKIKVNYRSNLALVQP
jgi:hypothetical protein